MTVANEKEQMRVVPRAWRFLRKPFHEQSISVYRLWSEIFPGISIPVRLPFGAWWVPQKDGLRGPLLAGRFEAAELAFVERLLQPGMTVLDLGAHHGLYTLLASKKVGRDGRVFAFEPSPRERRALERHLRINFCRNASVQGVALGDQNDSSDLYVVEDKNNGCNSLRTPLGVGSTSAVRVDVVRLDDWLRESEIDHVDFMKLDVEGAEWAVLKGAPHLLESKHRPVILAEVQDVRTKPWGYRAKEIIEHLVSREYKWFAVEMGGRLTDLDLSLADFEGNFVACPLESSLGT